MKLSLTKISILTLGLCQSLLFSNNPTYDPLKLEGNPQVNKLDLLIVDKARDREIPVLIYLPELDSPAPIVLFSHGLGGSRNNNPYLGNHFSARGYVAVFIQHPGSDESVWKDVDRRKRFKAMKEAANVRNSRFRFQDVPKVIDQLEAWNKNEDHALYKKLDTKHIGMSGHSYGAVTMQAVSGQRAMGGLISMQDERISAAIAYSPSSPRRGNAKRAFSRVDIPWLLMTGTKDLSPIGNATLESRLGVYPALPPGDKYELVLYNAEHSAFSERALPGDKESRNPNHHKAILALSTAFWDAYLKNQDVAKDWLKGDDAKAILEEKDRWQFK